MCSAFKSSQSVITCTSLIRSSWSYFRHIFHHSMANSTGMEGCWRKICWWLQLRCASLTRSCFAGLDHQISCFVWGSFRFPRLNMKSPPCPPSPTRADRVACAVLDVGEGEGDILMFKKFLFRFSLVQKSHFSFSFLLSNLSVWKVSTSI